MEAAVRAAVLSDAALRLPEIARIRHMGLCQIRSYRSSRSSRREILNSREKAQKAQKKDEPQPRTPKDFRGNSLRGEMNADLRR